MRERRFRAYCAGIAKTGTTSIAGILSKYRAAHEFMFSETTKAISDYRTGIISKEEFVKFLHGRDQKGNLEMDSASFNFNYLDILVEEYRDAKFIATIRDCYSWLDSMLNMLVAIDIKDWMMDFGSRSFGIRITREMFSSRDALISALPEIVDGLLKYWAGGQQFSLDNLPKERSLVIRTDEISQSLERIAHFLGVPEDTLSWEQSHLFKAAKKFNILHDMDFNLLQEKFETHCATLMQKYFPDRTLEGFLKRSKKRPEKKSTMLNKLNECISRGINFLYNEQLPDGEFPSYRIFTREGGGTWMPDTAIFPTALIAHSLRFLKGQKAHEMINRAKIFLLAEMHPPGVWKYSSKKSGITIFPDLDDTCCAAAVLLEDRPQILKNNVSRILNNRDQNGLFYTWLKPEKDGENDIDSVVNANVLFYLKEFKGIEKVVYYLYTLISEKKEQESYWYYISPAALYYMVARAYANGANRLEICAEIIANRIIQDRLASGACGNETETAMDLCTLLYFEKYDLSVMRPAIDYLIHCQHENGSWQRQQFYAGPPPPIPHAVWFGSEALTTAFCLEALSRVSIMKVINDKSTMGNNSVEHKKKIVPQRHFRAYNVGIAKTGTTSIAGILAKYRTKHEFMLPETIKAITDYRTGVISKEGFVGFLHTRDQIGSLEMDSASFNFNYLDILVEEYRDAKFIATIRDCYSWLDSVLNNLLLVREIKDWMIDFGSKTFGVNITREIFSSRQNLIRALPGILDGILGYWAKSLQFTMDKLPAERSLVIKTSEISDSLGRIAGFLGIPEDTLVREKSHLLKAVKQFNILHNMDFNVLNEKFEVHCGPLMRTYFPERTLETFFKESQEKHLIRGATLSMPRARMSWGSDQTADLLFELIDDLKLEHKFERSVKMMQKKLLGNRFMLGFYKSQIKRNPHERLLAICRRMNMPESLLQAFSENLSHAEGVGFGFEESEGFRVYKAYLDFMDKWKREIKGSPNDHDPFPAILGFEWDVLDNTKHGLASYICYPYISFEEIRSRIADVFENDRRRKTISIAYGLLDMASSKVTHDKVLYLDVAEKDGQKSRFDINMYKVNLQLKELYPLLQKILQHYSIPENKFHELYNQIRTQTFGHLSGGINREGKDFLTIYHGIETITKAKKP